MKFFEKACVFVDVVKLVDTPARGAGGESRERSSRSIDTKRSKSGLVLVTNHVSPRFCFAFYRRQLHIVTQGAKMKNMVTASQAAEKIGCSQATVSRWADRLGYMLKYGSSRVLTEKQVERISNEWKKKAGNPNFGKK